MFRVDNHCCAQGLTLRLLRIRFWRSAAANAVRFSFLLFFFSQVAGITRLRSPLYTAFPSVRGYSFIVWLLPLYTVRNSFRFPLTR